MLSLIKYFEINMQLYLKYKNRGNVSIYTSVSAHMECVRAAAQLSKPRVVPSHILSHVHVVKVLYIFLACIYEVRVFSNIVTRTTLSGGLAKIIVLKDKNIS